jgi:hypothetical protein
LLFRALLRQAPPALARQRQAITGSLPEQTSKRRTNCIPAG